MDKELFWVAMTLIITTGVMAIAILALLLRGDMPGWGRRYPGGITWRVEMWNISQGYQVVLQFTNTFVLGRMSLYECIVSNRPMAMDATVSREHCMFYEQGGMLLMWNMSAVNPALVNGHRIDQPMPVVPGDRLEMGNSVFLITVAERI